MFVTFDKHQRFKFFIIQTKRRPSGLNFQLSSSEAEKPCVRNLKIADYFFKLGYDVFSCAMASELSASAA